MDISVPSPTVARWCRKPAPPCGMAPSAAIAAAGLGGGACCPCSSACWCACHCCARAAAKGREAGRACGTLTAGGGVGAVGSAMAVGRGPRAGGWVAGGGSWALARYACATCASSCSLPGGSTGLLMGAVMAGGGAGLLPDAAATGPGLGAAASGESSTSILMTVGPAWGVDAAAPGCDAAEPGVCSGRSASLTLFASSGGLGAQVGAAGCALAAWPCAAAAAAAACCCWNACFICISCMSCCGVRWLR
mmetsp:Transcript_18588/g.47090  ORF Transcript_18588/g.47090 Transcript_18588/m.47090 type:complete len:249 (-) Transcript_18588:28-774(-)